MFRDLLEMQRIRRNTDFLFISLVIKVIVITQISYSAFSHNFDFKICPHCCLYVSLVSGFSVFPCSLWCASTMLHCMLFLWRPSGLSPSSINTNSIVMVILVPVLLRGCVRVSLVYVLPGGVYSYGICKPSVLPEYVKVDLALCPCQQLASFSLIVFVFTSLRDAGSFCFVCIFWFLMSWLSLHDNWEWAF